MRTQFLVGLVGIFVAIAVGTMYVPAVAWSLLVAIPLAVMGLRDYRQTRQAIRRNFPIVGNFRYLFEAIRPEINQYFVESNTDGVPFNRDTRSLVYQRAKRESDTLPFGTRLDVYAPGYEWVNHSLRPNHVDPALLRITVGGPRCTKPWP